jgi:nucleoside-diphosphate-sugar epimerase
VHLVLGAAGYPGRHVVAALGDTVRVRTAELSDDLESAMSGVEVVHLALTPRSPLQRPLRPAPPPHPLLAWLMRLGREAGVRRVVALSSISVFGFSREGLITERTRLRPEHGYERALAADETWLREQYRPEVVVLRPAQGFGPDEQITARLFEWVAAGGVSLPGGGTASRTFLAGADLGRAFQAAALRGEPGAAYLLGGVHGSWRELLRAVAVAMGARPRLGRTSYDLAYLGAFGGLGRTPMGRACWPTPFVVDLLARPQVVMDGWSRRELTWQPQMTTFAAGLTELAARHPRPAPSAEPDQVPWPEPAPQRRLT